MEKSKDSQLRTLVAVHGIYICMIAGGSWVMVKSRSVCQDQIPALSLSSYVS